MRLAPDLPLRLHKYTPRKKAISKMSTHPAAAITTTAMFEGLPIAAPALTEYDFDAVKV